MGLERDRHYENFLEIALTKQDIDYILRQEIIYSRANKTYNTVNKFNLQDRHRPPSR